MTSLSRLIAGRRRWYSLAAVVLVLVLVGFGIALINRAPAIRTSSQFVTGTPEPGGAAVQLDTTLYLPAKTPAPAILLAHGFGGSKTDLASQATKLARDGYVVLAYTARGFGRSGGDIHLDALQYEVADGSKLLDYLQTRPEVERTATGIVAGVAGSSYGGALALQLGAVDHRISAVAADITWNSLANALFPNTVAGSAESGGVFKKLWAGYLFSAGFSTTGTGNSSCGRFAAALCAQYQRASSGQPVDASFAALLAQSSPATVLSKMSAPVLLTQGEQDSLFPLSEADANAKALRAAGAPVQVRWRSGGHDAPSAGDDVAGWQQQFFDQRLRGHSGSSNDFLLSELGASISSSDGRTVDSTLKAASYPTSFTGGAMPLVGPAQQISAPAGGSPAAVSTIPGLGSLLGTAASLGSAFSGTAVLGKLPGQTAAFATAPLTDSTLVTGSSTVTLSVKAGSTGAVTLFAALHDIAPDGTDTLPQRLVAPISVTGAPNATHRVTVQLPWIVAQVPAGHRLAVEVSTTDFSYQLPAAAQTYTVALATPTLTVPSVPTSKITGGGALGWVIAAVVVVLLCLAYGGWRLRARRPSAPDAALAQVPIVVTDLEKVYGDGYRAVDRVSFRVERGQVLGLLGPNGAGKTTTLRVLMGLILPTAGTIRVFGQEVVPGAPVLAKLGAFVEGPGFLPHLSGAENLRLFWAASGRPAAEAQLDIVLQIAGLGDSLQRKVKTYSHGMQQRLAIAQAMLGLPEVLVLDEPTNGLDPPQIAEMRVVLGAYAATGRTVIVSSHLLAEVEQTCSHVVVMHRGQLVAAGSVAEVAGAGATQLVVDEPERAERVLAEAGISSRAVPARRALEDVFLDLIGERND